MSNYKPSYVDSWKKSKSKLNLDNYTRLVGTHLFPLNMIYRPLTIAVSLNPDVSYNLQVDTSRPDWNEILCSGVKQMMGVPDHVYVSIKDSLGRDVSTLHLRDLVDIGLTYPHVEDQGRFASKKLKLGNELDVPDLLSTNKRALFKDWMEGVSDRIVDAVSDSLAECDGVAQIGDRLTLKSKKSIKGQIVNALRRGFKESVGIHSTNLDVNEVELADQTSNLIMAAVVEGFKQNKDRVRDYFHAVKVAKQQNSASPRSEEDRNMFESDITSSVGASLRKRYPDQKELFSEIIQTSLEKENIGRHVYYMMVRGGKRPTTRRRRRHAKKKHHHHHHRRHTEKKVSYHRRRRKMHPGRNYEMYTSDKGTYFRVLEKGHQRRGRPRFRKTVAPGPPRSRPKQAVDSGIASGLPSLYSAEAPSLETVGHGLSSMVPMNRDEVPSLEICGVNASIEPISMSTKRSMPSLMHDVPSLEAVSVRDDIPSLEAISSPLHEDIPDIESIWSDEEGIESPPALEAIGSDYSEDEYLSTPPPQQKVVQRTPKYRGTVSPSETLVVESDVLETVYDFTNSGLPSLSSMKKELGLPSDDSSSSLKASYSSSIDGPVYGNSMTVIGHYLRCCKKHHRRRHHHHRRRRVYVATSNKIMGPIQTQEIQELTSPGEIEEYIASYVASSYEENSGTIGFTTADGKIHKIRSDGAHFVDGRRLTHKVQKLVEQDVNGEPMLLVLEHNE